MKNQIKQTWLLTLLLLVSMFTACKKDKDPVVNNPTVTSSIFGRVVDENGNGVYGATAIAGGKTTTTDANGIFRINNASLDKNHAFVKITKAGFFDGSRTFIASSGNINNVEIRLLTKTLKGTFSAASGATVTVTADATVTFPANAIKKADGTIYTGTVNVYAAYLDPTDANLDTKMPGDLLGVRTDNSESVLQSFGMLNVELEDASGNKLNIVDGKEATISATIPASLLATAPTTIPLWHFDTNTGLWKEEGSAALTAGKYIGNVKHFTWWNCDYPTSVINLSFHMVDVDGNSFSNLLVGVTVLSNGSSRYNSTSYNGMISGSVPKNTAMKLTYKDACGNIQFIQNIGPFSTNTNLGNIVLNTGVALGKYIGKIVNCSNVNVSNGYVKYTNGLSEHYAIADQNGDFSFIIPNCSGSSDITVTAYDMDGLQQGIAQSFPFATGTTNLGNIAACNSTIQEYIQFQIDGGSTNFLQNVAWSNYNTTTNTSGDNSPLNPGKSFLIQSDIINNTGIIPFQGFQINDGLNTYYTNGNIGCNITHIVTQYPAIGGYIEGTINGSFAQFGSGVIHTINGSYRIKRTQ